MIKDPPISPETLIPLQSDASAGVQNAPLSLSRFISILRKRKKSILLNGLVGLLVLAVFAYTRAPSYTATASFLPPESSGSSGTMAMLSQISGLGAASLLGGSKSQADLCIGILKSHTVSDKLIERFHLMELYKVKKLSNAEGILQGRSLFLPGTKDPLVNISVTDGNPVLARDLTNAYLDALQETSATLAVSESSQRRLFYEQRLAKEKDELANAEVALKQMEEQTGLVAPAGQTMSHIQAQAQTQAQITERESRLAVLLSKETEENPEVISLRSEIGSLRGHLHQTEKGTNSDELSTTQMPALQLEYVRRARDVKYHETLFEILSKQYEAARLDESRDTPLQVLDRATTPDSRSGPHRSLFMLFGIFAGLAFGISRALLQAMKGSR
jgi:tyrosine-protein kinase Etk/Wzc